MCQPYSCYDIAPIVRTIWVVSILRPFATNNGAWFLNLANPHTGWCPPVTSWFINPMTTIVCSSTNHRNQRLIRQVNAIFFGPHPVPTKYGFDQFHIIHSTSFHPKKNDRVPQNHPSLQPICGSQIPHVCCISNMLLDNTHSVCWCIPYCLQDAPTSYKLIYRPNYPKLQVPSPQQNIGSK